MPTPQQKAAAGIKADIKSQLETIQLANTYHVVEKQNTIDTPQSPLNLSVRRVASNQS